MKYSFLLLSLVAGMAMAQEQHRIPVTQTVQECIDKTNLGGAAVGAGVGYVAGRVGGRLLGFRGKSSSLIGAAAGGLIGANSNQEKSCHQVEKLIGHKVLTVKNGKLVESFEPAQ